MSPKGIPGFYYDESKKKYFKILPNHAAPHGSKYSSDSIRKGIGAEISRKRAEAFQEKIFSERTHRSKILGHPLLGDAGLVRERGMVSDLGDVSAAAWARGLERTEVFPFETASSLLFAYDDVAGIYVTNQGSYQGSLTPGVLTRYLIPPYNKRFGPSAAKFWGAALHSQISSIAISPARVVMTTAMGGSRPACIHLTRLNTLDSVHEHFASNTSCNPFTNDVGIIIHPTNHGTTFWASTPRPRIDRSDFALATSSGTVLIAENNASWSIDCVMGFIKPRSDAIRRVGAEILAVDWLDENVVINGGRDGGVRLWDVRSRSSAAGTSAPLVHPSAINHVRKLNANRVVVAGIENWMALYDLRFLGKSKGARGVTDPFMEFSTYRNREWSGLEVGFDVWRDRFVACGTDDERVQIFDTGTKREVEAGNAGALSNRKLGGLARCLKFIEGGKGEGLKLAVAAGRGIEEWEW